MTSKWYRNLIIPNSRETKKSPIQKRTSPVIQMDYDSWRKVKQWDSLTHYINENNLTRKEYAGIYNNLVGGSKSAYGYRWMWKEDWEEWKKDGRRKL